MPVIRKFYSVLKQNELVPQITCSIHVRLKLQYVLVVWFDPDNMYFKVYKERMLGRVHTWCPSTEPEYDSRWALM